MQIADEIVAVFFGQTHEGAAHHNEFDLVDGVAELLELLHAMSSLGERIVSCSDRSHACRFVASVALG